MSLQPIALAFLAAVAIGGVMWVFVYPFLSGERKAEQRKASIAKAEPVLRVREARTSQRSRREQVETSLREVEERNRKQKKLSLTTRIEMAGLEWSKQKFYIISAFMAATLFALVMIISGSLWVGLLALFAGGFGLPRWMLNYLRKRREAKFLDSLPDAVDVIVRGIKAGLPLFDSIKVVAADAPEPLKSEFLSIVDSQAIGIPLGEACTKLYERIPVPEANFFGIVIAIQQKSGGNLSEALGNLSRVLRDRKKMKGKIQAMSMEAKASAAIIGSLPIVVMGLVYLTSPAYISLLWTEPAGRLMLVASGMWMTLGVLVMKKMINFDF